jgi:hypothetical protein
MKHVNLKKAVEKFGVVTRYEHGKSRAYTAEVEGCIITWIIPYYTPEEAACVNVRHKDDQRDWVSDYHAGSYYDTIKSAINALTYNLRKKEEAI